MMKRQRIVAIAVFCALAIAAGQAVRETAQARAILEHYESAEIRLDVVLPDYRNLERPLVEVFTLDSSTCAACGYMLEAAKDMKEIFGDAIDLVEYKFTVKENIARCVKMGVAKLPAIYLDGRLAFSSIIPSRKELEEKIRALQKAKSALTQGVFSEDGFARSLNLEDLRFLFQEEVK